MLLAISNPLDGWQGFTLHQIPWQMPDRTFHSLQKWIGSEVSTLGPIALQRSGGLPWPQGDSSTRIWTLEA
jgi:hypothetical protein